MAHELADKIRSRNIGKTICSATAMTLANNSNNNKRLGLCGPVIDRRCRAMADPGGGAVKPPCAIGGVTARAVCVANNRRRRKP